MAEWPPFGEDLLTRLTVCSLYIMSFCNFSYCPFWFWGQILPKKGHLRGFTYIAQYDPISIFECFHCFKGTSF